MTMKILYLTRALPYPPHSGGDIAYSRNVIELLQGGAELTVAALDSGAEIQDLEYEYYIANPVRTSRAASLLSDLPNIAYKSHSMELKRYVLKVVEGFDVVIVDHLSMAWLVRIVRKKLGKRSSTKLIYITHNNESELRPGLAKGAKNPIVRLALRIDGLKAALLEREALQCCDGYTAITTTDLATFTKLYPDARGCLLMPTYSGSRRAARSISDLTPRRVCVLGGRGTFYKKLILKKFLEALERKPLPHDVIVDVVGAGVEDVDVSPLRNSRVNFKGFIPDIESYLDTVRIAVVPDMIGGGFKVRTMALVFSRTPIIAVSGALAGMGLIGDSDFIDSPTLDHLIEYLSGALEDFDTLNKLHNSAFNRWDSQLSFEFRQHELMTFLGRVKSDQFQ